VFERLWALLETDTCAYELLKTLLDDLHAGLKEHKAQHKNPPALPASKRKAKPIRVPRVCT